MKDITKSEIIKVNNQFLAVTKLDFKSLYLNNLITKLVPESQKSCISVTIMFADKKTWLRLIYNNTCFAKSWGAHIKAKYGISRVKWGFFWHNSKKYQTKLKFKTHNFKRTRSGWALGILNSLIVLQRIFLLGCSEIRRFWLKNGGFEFCRARNE